MQYIRSEKAKGATKPGHAYRLQVKPGTTAVIGIGYVGLPLALLLEERGFQVIGFDIDQQKVLQLQQRKTNVLTSQEHAQFEKSRMHITADPESIAEADVVIICVPTPVTADHAPNLKPLVAAARLVGLHLRRGALVVVESTVNPGVCDTTVLPIIARYSNMIPDRDFYFAHAPERINPGDATWSARNIARVVGANSRESLERATALYRSIIDAPIEPMQSVKEAEAVKIVENAFRDINIAFVNELAMSFARLGIDVTNVIRGAATKPFAFMAHDPGCGVGGHCIPVDPYYLIAHAAENGFQHQLLKEARRINSLMPIYTVDLLEYELSIRDIPLAQTDIALLGLSYKAGIGDTRESPAYIIRDELRERGATVWAFDPYVRDESDTHSIADTLSGATAAIVATNHPQFTSLSPTTFLDHNVRIVIDGRNCLSKQDFLNAEITYRGIGR